jgi:hypothetical protein
MAPSTLLTTVILTAAMAAPAMAQDNPRRRTGDGDNPSQPKQTERAPARAAGEDSARPGTRKRAVQRTVPPPQERDNDARREAAARSDQARSSGGNTNNGRYDNNRYDNRGRAYGRNGVTRYVPRVVRPTIVRVAPYRPYVYRPSYRMGVYYGSGGYYPYGPTPRGYYDPLPGRYYGGVRITGVPRDAQVFADGYYVGLVNDFDGVFQHMNLEAGRHHIEIDWGGYEPIAFDVYVRPGETTTFRGDGYFGRY